MPTQGRFQRWLANELIRHHMTDMAFAEQMGVSHVTVGRWKRGTRPQDSQLVKMANLLNVDLLEIYAQLGAVPVRPEDLPVDVREIVRKLLALTPEQRQAFDAMLGAMQVQVLNAPHAATGPAGKATEK